MGYNVCIAMRAVLIASIFFVLPSFFFFPSSSPPLGLPGNQLALLQAVVDARGGSVEGIVVVFVSGGSVSSTWVRDNIPTVQRLTNI